MSRVAKPAAATVWPASADFPVLETERLVLREIGTADAPDLLAIHGDVEAMRWFGCDPIRDLAAANGLVHAFASWRRTGTGIRWGIERREDGRFLGSCGLFGWDRDCHRCTLGYELGNFAWGGGYMRETLAAVLPWAFARMRLHRIDALIHPSNTASLRLAHSVGFVEEGRLRGVAFWGGRQHDMLMLSLLEADHRAAQSRPPRLGTAPAGPWQRLLHRARQLLASR